MISLGNTSANYNPTTGNWTTGGGTTLLLNASDHSTIGFHDGGNRVDFIRVGLGVMQLGYNGGWGSPTVQVPNLAGSGNRVVIADASGNLTTQTIGSMGDNLGNHTATTTLNMNNQSISNVSDILAVQNYGRGLVGLYSATRYQNVFAMGAAYRLAANGTTPGNLYGIAWTHSNVGGESIAGLGHQALFMSNGDTRSAIGDGIWTKYNATAARFYDYNDANYYVDPASVSYFNDIRPNIIYDRNNTGYYWNGDGLSRMYQTRTNYNDITAGTDYGVRFWDGNQSYSIKMGNNQQDYGWVTDYSIHSDMGTTDDRGFTWGYSRTGVVASLEAETGHFSTRGVINTDYDYRMDFETIINGSKQLAGGLLTWTDARYLGQADNLGNHSATTTLDMNNHAIIEAGRYEPFGIGGTSGQGNHSYAIFQENGAWTNPYPDMRIAYHTGLKLGAYYGYNGTRFYNNSDMATQTFSVNDGDNNTRFYYDLRDGSNNRVVIDDNGGWHRSYGANGLYNGTYGGGIYMTDATWVRTYNNKNFHTHSTIGDRYAIYGRKNANVSGGSYYDATSGVRGYHDNPSYGDNYRFGTWGQYYQNYNGLGWGWRSGGVLGSYQDNGGGRGWGALGYNNSSGTFYGMYASYNYTSGGGYLTDNQHFAVGGGLYGGVIGAWSRGEVMGHINAGELFASYNVGDEYTSGRQIELVDVGDKRVAAYSVSSVDVKVYADGNSSLSQGTKYVAFDRDYSSMLGSTPNVTVTPIGESNGFHLVSLGKDGFTVKENSGGSSNIQFTWIAVGTRIDAADKPELHESLADKNFDSNMKGVMFNESNTEQSATPIWWDGSKVRFDLQPGFEKNKKAAQSADESIWDNPDIVNHGPDFVDPTLPPKEMDNDPDYWKTDPLVDPEYIEKLRKEEEAKRTKALKKALSEKSANPHSH